MRTAAVYCRVSTKKQKDEGSSLGSQAKACLALAKAEGYEVPEGYLCQEDWPGTELARPELDRVRELVRQRLIQALIVYSTDRLARNPIHVGLIAEESQKNGVRLVFVSEPLDVSPEGMLIAYVKGYAAQLEREKIKDRTVRGKLERARSGKLPQGTGRGMYGYRYEGGRDGSGKRVVVEREAQVVRRMFRLASEGFSPHRIATVLNADDIPSLNGGRWHPFVVRRMLHNSTYSGKTYYRRTKRIALEGRKCKHVARDSADWVEIRDATPAIVTDMEFQQAQAALALPKRVCRPAQHYLLTGHAVCGICGGSMNGSILGGRYRYYMCRRRWDRHERKSQCTARYTRADALEESVFKELRSAIEHPEVVLAEVRRMKSQGSNSHIDSELRRIDAQARQLRIWEQRMVRLYGFGEIDDDFILRETRKAKGKMQESDRERERLLVQKREIDHLDASENMAIEYCRRLSEKLGHLGHEEKRLLLEALQVKVVVGPDRIEIQGAIPSYATIAQTSGYCVCCT